MDAFSAIGKIELPTEVTMGIRKLSFLILLAGGNAHAPL
jgi:hypothetical protein